MLEKLKDLFARRPSAEWIKSQELLTKCTPDWWRISQLRRTLVFAYGEDQPGYSMYNSLHGPETIQLGEAYTAELMTVFFNENPRFPVAMKQQFRYTYPISPHTSVKGELLLIDTHKIIELGNYFENTKTFLRERVWLTIPYVRKELTGYDVRYVEGAERVAAWIYIGISTFWNDKIDGGFNFQPVARHDNLFMKDFYYYENTIKDH